MFNFWIMIYSANYIKILGVGVANITQVVGGVYNDNCLLVMISIDVNDENSSYSFFHILLPKFNDIFQL